MTIKKTKIPVIMKKLYKFQKKKFVCYIFFVIFARFREERCSSG